MAACASYALHLIFAGLEGTSWLALFSNRYLVDAVRLCWRDLGSTGLSRRQAGAIRTTDNCAEDKSIEGAWR